MARKRMIDPHIWEDPSFNKLSIQSRYIFIGLISNADDEGYFRADHGTIKRLLFGFDEIKKEDVIIFLKEIQTKMLTIHFYQNNNEAYGHFIKWNKYQIQRKERVVPTIYEKCTNGRHMADKCQTSVRQVSAQVKLREVKLSKDNKKESNKEKDPHSQKEFLTNKDFQDSLKEIFPLLDISEEIEKMIDWLAAEGVAKRDYAAFARNWLRKAKPEETGGGVVIVRE